MAPMTANKSISGPKASGIKGHLTQFSKNPLRFFTELTRDYPGIAKIRFGPIRTVYVLSDPDLIKEVLVTKQQSFTKANRMKGIKPIMGEGLLRSEGDFHLRQRRLMQPMFTKSHINSYAQTMIDTTEELIGDWKDGEERHTTRDMLNITLQIITRTMFSMDMQRVQKPLDSELEGAFGYTMHILTKRARSLLVVPDFIPTKDHRNLKKSIQGVDDIIYGFINARRNDPASNREDLLGMLMKARDEDDGSGMTDKQLRDELTTIFLAGHETTANNLLWTWYLLSQNPDKKEKMWAEIDAVTGDNVDKGAHNRPLVPEDFEKLPYTQNVLWESMRLFPPAWTVSRQAAEGVEIGGYAFKKGDVFFMPQYIMHRNPAYSQTRRSSCLNGLKEAC
jgi:cytochrome P450